MFLGKADILTEDVLWKELLIFFMNTKETSGYLRFLREIEPLNFDPGLVDEYLDCFQSDAAKAMVVGEVETHYEDMEKDVRDKRLEMMGAIAASNVDFSDYGEEDSYSEDDDDEDWELKPPQEYIPAGLLSSRRTA